MALTRVRSLFCGPLLGRPFPTVTATAIGRPIGGVLVCVLTVVLLGVHSSAGAAAPLPSTRDGGVRFVERMSPFALDLPFIDSSGSDAAKDVFPQCHQLHVGGVHASAITAQVVDAQPIRDRADEVLVGKAMRCDHLLAFSAITISPAKVDVVGTVPGIPDRATPVPAARRRIDVVLATESFWEDSVDHLGTFFAVECANGEFDNCCLRKAQSLRESANESETFRGKSIAGREFIGHEAIVPLLAVGVK